MEPLWNTDWLTPTLTTNLPYSSIVDEEALKKVTPVITFKEARRYEESEYYKTESQILKKIEFPHQ